ncbi:MAG: type II toxin-antitoxin system Phd/YefM family antitoxin [Bacteriovorax sp.]|nr:type II toxin-antitoxin system Phd/YefM family antitoxin [Bacteriovorax sp.]
MENTSPKKLRAKLKDYLDLAKKEAVRIKRRSGQHFILVSEEKYNELKMELTSLQKRLLGKNHVVEKENGKEKTKGKAKDKVKAKIKTKSKDKSKDKVKVKEVSKEKKDKVKKATKKVSKVTV